MEKDEKPEKFEKDLYTKRFKQLLNVAILLGVACSSFATLTLALYVIYGRNEFLDLLWGFILVTLLDVILIIVLIPKVFFGNKNPNVKSSKVK